jgi:predicted nucleotidyltransferase
MDQRLHNILSELHSRLKELHGDRLMNVVLYGSQARGDARPASGIDVLIVLKGPVEPIDEDRSGDIAADLSLRYDTLISCLYMDQERFRGGVGPLVRNIQREGIPV